MNFHSDAVNTLDSTSHVSTVTDLRVGALCREASSDMREHQNLELVNRLRG